MKQAIFTVIDNGTDGTARDNVVFASVSEVARDKWLEKNPNKNWYRTKDIVGDLEVLKKNALKKLDGLDRLALGL